MITLLLSIINAVFSAAGTLANALVLFVIFSNEDLRVGPNFFVASLAAADLIVCALCQTWYVYFLNVPWSWARYLTFKSVAYVGLHASFANLLLLTTHRFIALRRPYSHSTLFRGKTIGACVACVWISSLTIAVIFTFTVVSKIAPYCHLAMLTVFIFTHVHILFIVHKQRRQIQIQQESLSYNHRVARMQYAQMTTGTLAILCGTSVLLFFPDLLVQFLKIDDYVRLRSTFTTMFMNSFLNPCIYVWRGKRFRKVLFKTSRFSVADDPRAGFAGTLSRIHASANSFEFRSERDPPAQNTPKRTSLNTMGVENLQI